MLFGFREPLLALHQEDQELLRAALKGLTDEELALELRLKLPTVKKRWAAIFQRIAAARPDPLPDVDRDLDRQTRGKQKRHYLLEYLRGHPEEVRPYLRQPAAAVRPRRP